MKKLVLSVVALVATVSVSAHAGNMCEANSTSSRQVTKQVDANFARDVQVAATAQPVVASWNGQMTLASVGTVPMTVNNVVGEPAYAVARIVKHTVDAGECTLGAQAPGLPAGVSCAIQLPGKLITVALTGANNVISGVIVDVLYGIPSTILNASSGVLVEIGNSLNAATGVLGYPVIVLSGVLTATGEALKMTAYVVQTVATGVWTTTSVIICIPYHVVNAILKSGIGQALYNMTFGLIGNVLTGVCNLIKSIPPSPCDGIGNDRFCQPGPAATARPRAQAPAPL